MDPLEVLGMGSAFAILYAFVANEYGWLPTRSYAYDLVNFLGSLGLFYYAFAAGVVPFMLTNAVWAGVSGVDTIKHLRKRYSFLRSWRGFFRMLRMLKNSKKIRI